MTPTTKITSAVAAGVLGLAVTGAAAFAAVQPSEPASPAAALTDTTSSALDQDRRGGPGVKAVLDKLVTAGTITQAQEDAILKALKDAAPSGKGRADAHPKVVAAVLRDLMKTSAGYLGLPAGQLKQQLAAGKSLGHIADATAGKSRQGLVDALTADATAKVDKLRAEAKITAEQAATIKAQLPDRITKLVDHVVPAKRHADGAKPRS